MNTSLYNPKRRTNSPTPLSEWPQISLPDQPLKVEAPVNLKRRFLVDTFFGAACAIPLGMFQEVVLSGLTIQQSLMSRAMATPVNIALGGIFGKYRDWCYDITKTSRSNQTRAFFIDILSSLTFSYPLYSAILAINGATPQQITTAIISKSALTLVTARPLGILRDYVRRKLDA